MFAKNIFFFLSFCNSKPIHKVRTKSCFLKRLRVMKECSSTPTYFATPLPPPSPSFLTSQTLFVRASQVGKLMAHESNDGFKIKIGRLQTKKLRNTYVWTIQFVKKIRVCALCSVQYVHSKWTDRTGQVTKGQARF